MKLFLIICLLLSIAVGDRRRYRKYHHHYQKSHKKSWSPAKDRLKMPSGMYYKLNTVHAHQGRYCKDKAYFTDVSPTDKKWKNDYKIIEKEFKKSYVKSYSLLNIVKIQKVYNPCLYKTYLYYRKNLKLETSHLNERMLFHGSNALDGIMQTGFNEQYANTAGYFGAGLYFADHSSKSNDYAKLLSNGNKQMLLCRVLLGRVHKQSIPQSYAHAPPRHHSIEGQLPDKEYIVYKKEQVSVSLSEVGKQVRSKRDAETTNSENFDNYEENEENSSDEKNEEADKSPELTRKEKSYIRSYLASLLEKPQYSKHRLIEPVQPPRDRQGEQFLKFERNPFESDRDYGKRHRHNRHGSRNRGHGGGDRKRYRNNTGRVWTSELRMPDGKKVNITDPPYSDKWSCPDTATLIQLKSDEIEYGLIKQLLKSREIYPEISIQKIEKITNQCLWKKYRYKKTQISNDIGKNDVTEMLLFYAGFPGGLSDITNEGLDERDLTMQSNEFGAAFEFTTTLYYAGWDSESSDEASNSMLLFRVALGNVQNVTSTTRLAHAPVGFHSVNKDDLYAIYIRGDQVYPEFLITFTDPFQSFLF